jgi:Domain of unknown function (DUF4145)
VAVTQAASSSRPPAPDIEVSAEPTPEEKTRFEQIAEVSPRAAILDLRRELEQAVIAAAGRHGLQGSPSKQLTLTTATRLLRNHGIIDAHTSALLNDLRSIGNAAAHGEDDFNLSKDAALRFRKLADQVITRLLEA